MSATKIQKFRLREELLAELESGDGQRLTMLDFVNDL